LQSRRQNEDDSKPSTIEERRTRLDMIWNDPFLRNLWQGLSRTFVSDCKQAYSRLADTLKIQC